MITTHERVDDTAPILSSPISRDSDRMMLRARCRLMRPAITADAATIVPAAATASALCSVALLVASAALVSIVFCELFRMPILSEWLGLSPPPLP